MSNTHQISRTEFIALTACIMLLTALGIDIMLPAFQEVRHHFGLSPESTATARIVTFFFMGQMGQLLFGPLSDRYGRLPVLRMGFGLYITGCVATAFSPGLTGIWIARFIQGLGASALFVSAIAGVRDRFAGDAMARTMSLVLTIFLMIPVVAPALGALILRISNWQMVFLTPGIVAIVVFAWTFRLHESLSAKNRNSSGITSLAQNIVQLGKCQQFVRYTAITTVLFAAFSSFVSSSERIISELYGRPSLFIWIFACAGAIMACFSLLNAHLVARFGARRAVRGLLTMYVSMAVLLLLLTLQSQTLPPLFLFFSFISLLQGINIAAEPNSSSLALEPAGHIAGMAAAVYSTSYLVGGALLGSFIDQLLAHSVVPLSVAYCIGGVLAVLLVYTDRDSRTKHAATSVTCSHMEE